MRPQPMTMICVLLLLAMSSGCAARQVYRDTDSGIVAIPSNSNAWPLRFRDKADELMAGHFPNGYEIVREEETVIGQTTSYEEDETHTDVEVIDNLLSLCTTETSGTETTMDETEYRIHYRRR